MSDAVLEGLLFDGRTAAATAVRVTVASRVLQVTTPAGEPLREVLLHHLVVTDPFANAPRQITFADGAVVEVEIGRAHV